MVIEDELRLHAQPVLTIPLDMAASGEQAQEVTLITSGMVGDLKDSLGMSTDQGNELRTYHEYFWKFLQAQNTAPLSAIS